jgi:uncharacterized protein
LILPDVNTLVYAFRREAERHERYASWLAGMVAGGDDLALTDVVTIGFVRIVTNPRIFAAPAPTADAVSFVDALRSGPRVRWLPPTKAAWDAFGAIVREDRAARGNLVPDAWLAALAVAHGARIATADRGFARFAGIDAFDPVLA